MIVRLARHDSPMIVHLSDRIYKHQTSKQHEKNKLKQQILYLLEMQTQTLSIRSDGTEQTHAIGVAITRHRVDNVVIEP